MYGEASQGVCNLCSQSLYVEGKCLAVTQLSILLPPSVPTLGFLISVGLPSALRLWEPREVSPLSSVCNPKVSFSCLPCPRVDPYPNLLGSVLSCDPTGRCFLFNPKF